MITEKVVGMKKAKDIKARIPKRLKSNKTLELTILALPALLLLLGFKYFPMFGTILAFKDFRYDKGILGSEWCGFDNFKFFFTSQDAIRITFNTLFLNALFIITVIGAAVFIAVLLNEVRSRRAIKVYQTAMFFPHFLSMTVVAYIVYAFLNMQYGLINNVLMSLGCEPIQWYSEAQYWRPILVIVNLWKTLGYNVIIFYAALMGLDKSYYESAAIDGANRIQMMFKITIPLMKPIIIMMFIMKMGQIFYADFGLFYLVTQNSGMLYATTDVIDTYVFRALRQIGDVGMAAAVGFYQSVLGLVMVLGTNWIIKKISPEDALF